MPQLTPEQVQRLKARGLNDARIAAVAQKNGYEMPKGFLARTGEEVIAGARDIGQGARMAASGVATLSPTKIIGGAAKAAGGAFQAAAAPVNETIVSTARAVVPEKVRTGTAEFLGEGANAVMNSAFGQEVAKQYARLKQQAPGAAAGVEGVADVALNLPILKGAASAVKLGASTVKATGGAVAEQGLVSAAKSAVESTEKRVLKWVGEPKGGEAGTKATGMSALEQAGRSKETKVKTGFFGIPKPAATTALKEDANRVRVFGNAFDDVGSDIDKAAKVVQGKIDELDIARVGAVQAADTALNATQRLQNTRYFGGTTGKFRENILAGTENLAMGTGEPTAEKLAQYLFDRIKARIDEMGDAKVLEATDQGISDFVRGAKQQFGEAAFETTERGKTAAKQALDTIRRNARNEVERSLNVQKGLADDYRRFAKDESVAINAQDDFLARYGKQFGKSVTKEGLGKVGTGMQVLGAASGGALLMAALTGGSMAAFTQVVAGVAAFGVTGYLAYAGLTHPALRKAIFGVTKKLTDKLPSTTGPERIELLEQIAIAAGIASALEAGETAKEESDLVE